MLSEQVVLFYKILQRLFSALIKHIRDVGAHWPTSGQSEPTSWITYGSLKVKNDHGCDLKWMEKSKELILRALS
ncbi:hypothetical protein [Absidia glauca]|uniref:Uncharacterized protein n=1 Tax=Absidia glauca TaxID=4829 RepID=A0A163IW58_ABSGL|nr:hypothetical protein [Absidia glauca]